MNRKFLFRALLVVLSLGLLLSGCQGSGTKQPSDSGTSNTAELKPVTLEWYNFIMERPDTDMVMKELNKYLKEKINATVNYHFFNAADYKTKMTTIISSGQEFDIAWCNSTRLSYPDNVQLGAFMPVEDMVKKYAPKASAAVPDYLWDAYRIKGHIYGVPVLKDLAQRWDMEFNKTMADKLGIDVTQKWASVNDLVPMFYKAKEAKDKMFPEDKKIPLSRKIISDTRAYYPRDMIVSFAITNVPGVEAFKGMGKGETVFNIYATDEYRKHAKLMKQLVDDGIFPYDSENYDKENVLTGQGKVFMQVNAGMVYTAPHAYSKQAEFILNNSTVAVMITQNLQGSIHVIGSTSKNPERALMLIELLNTDQYVANTLRYGLEKVHYNFDKTGDVYFTDSERNKDMANPGYFQSTGWFLGSVFNASPLASNPDNYNDLIKKMDASAISDTNIGFNFDPKPVTNELAACNNVIAEYDKNLMSGMLPNVDAVVDEFVKKLNAAGAQKVVDEAQKQLTEWRSANGKAVKK